MTNNYTSHKRKLRQLKSLSKRLQSSLHDASVSGEVEKLIQKVKRLVNELQKVFAAWQLKKVLGPACLFLGLSFSNNSSAQVTFASVVQNPFGLPAAPQYFSNAAVADFDNDGDKDFITGEFYGNFFYFQNTGTASAPAFAAPLMNSNGLAKTTDTSYHFVTVADLDNDGDKDLMTGHVTGALMYYQNTGSATAPTFAAPVQNPFGLTSVYFLAAPTFVDYDNDGDMDLVVGEYYGNLQYFQNTGTVSSPAFAAPVQNPGGITAVTDFAHPNFADLDNDGDKDLIVGESGGAHRYFQNTGTASAPVWGPIQTNPFGLTTVNLASMPSFVNFDNDGDWDLLTTDYDGNFNYFQNTTTPLSVKNLSGQTELVLYPNPATEVVYLKGREVQNVATVEVFDVNGRMVISQEGNQPLVVKELAEGFYTAKIVHVNGGFEVVKFSKK
jgi:hypothetical protein